MKTKASFLSTRQAENTSVSFDFREDKRLTEKGSERPVRKLKTNEKKGKGIFIVPANRTPYKIERFLTPVKMNEIVPDNMTLAMHVRRLQANLYNDRPKTVAKDLTLEFMKMVYQPPSCKKPLIVAQPSATISRMKLRRKAESPSKVSSTPQKNEKNIPRNQNKISVKEAIRYKDWVLKARPKILKSFFTALNLSNGVDPLLPELASFTFKYFIGPGNNSRLIEKCLNTRWWWSAVEEDEVESANFVWTQWKDQEIIETLEKFKDTLEVESVRGTEIRTNVQVCKENEKPANVDLSALGFNRVTKAQDYIKMKTREINSENARIYNKLEYNFEISNKKNLFYNLKFFYESIKKDPFAVIPLTFHVSSKDDGSYKEFENYYKENQDTFWIVKPGENSNRGNGIQVCNSLEEIKSIIKCSSAKRTFIIQKYIKNPFLIKQRKFDIRCFALITTVSGVTQGYFYNEGYIRTSCKPFTLDKNSKFIHLTNDAVQKQSEEYGKFESSNKLSFHDFEKYLNLTYPKPVNFKEEVISAIKQIVTETIQATSTKLDPNRRMNCFEILGYDFLLDEELKPWLLEVNTNPCLELASSHLTRIIPNMLDNALRIAVDPLFQEPKCYLKHMRNGLDLVENKFELVFHSCSGKGLAGSEVYMVPSEEEYCEDESVYSESSTGD